MARRGGMEPSYRSAPPREFESEDIFDWIRRQNNPIKLTPAATPRTEPRNPVVVDAVLAHIKNAPEAVAAAPEGDIRNN